MKRVSRRVVPSGTSIFIGTDSKEPPGCDLATSEEKPPPLSPYLNTGESFAEYLNKSPFKDVSPELWEDWKWQLRNRIRSMKVLGSMMELSTEEAQVRDGIARLPMAITPYYLSLFYGKGKDHPLRKAVVPTRYELLASPGESEDPLKEGAQSPVPGIVHRYPDRVLFLATSFCSTYCRYCTRSRMVGDSQPLAGKRRWEKAISYIEANNGIRDVLISGGDPLTLSDDALEWLLRKIRSIRHVEVIRIGTKVPVVLPQRVTYGLISMLRRYHPLYMSIHFTHPEELTPEVVEKVQLLADSGIPLGSQTVLLKGINDDLNTLKRLFTGLMAIRVRPYYLYQCDPIVGSSHFRTKVEKGVELMRGLRGFISGYALPTYVIDAPGGGGKVPVDLGYIMKIEKDKVLMKNFQGHIYEYPE